MAGLIPRYDLKASRTGGGIECHVASSHSTRIAVGDPVKLTGTGDDSLPTGQSPYTRKLAGVDVASSASDTIYGVVTAIRRDNTRLGDTGLPASTEGFVTVEIDPDIIYSIETDGTAFVDGDIGLNFDYDWAVSTLTGGISRSNVKLDVSGGGGTGTAQLRLQQIETDPNDSSIQYGLVTIVESRFRTATGVS